MSGAGLEAKDPYVHDPERCVTCNPGRLRPQRVGSLLAQYLERRAAECAGAAQARTQVE